MNRKAAFHNLGCKVNAYETEAMMEELKSDGYEIVPFAPGADVYVINTCTVTNIADRKSRQMLHRAREMNPSAVVVAVGCYVQDAGPNLKKDPAVDIVVGNSEKSKLGDILASYFAGEENAEYVDRIAAVHDYEELSVSRTQGRTRAFIKIQDGCNQFCSYCMIPYVRGRVRSRREDDILKEAARLAESGYREIVLTGIHISSYGLDFDFPGKNLQTPDAKDAKTNERLLHLIHALASLPDVKRIRLGSLEPGIMTERFVREISNIPKMCPQFHLSMQSGCDRTLRRMRRKYDTASFFTITELLRKYFEHPAITTDIITGFPGEDEDEFRETVEFVRKIHFAKTHIFKYSSRKGTTAAAMKDQNTEAVKHKRSRELIEIDRGMHREFASWYVGKEVEVLFEEEKELNGVRFLEGHTRESLTAYLPVKQEEDLNEAGHVLRAKVLCTDEEGNLILEH